MKKLFALALMSGFVYSASAQNQANMDASATQTVNLLLSNAIDVTFTATGLSTGQTVNIEFTNINDYVNGVDAPQQEIRVRSNKKFKVDVKTNAPTFSYSGSASPTPSMPVSDVLGLKLWNNLTGGNSSGGPYSSTSFYTLRDFNQNLLTDCNSGSNQTFSVIYRATPGFEYPAGTYAIDVVYTATQL